MEKSIHQEERVPRKTGNDTVVAVNGRSMQKSLSSKP